MQLASPSTIKQVWVEEVTSLKKDFKQKENKCLEEFLDIKALKEKVEDKLYKQDQSLQTVHMLCKPKPYYNEHNKIAICYSEPLCLTRAKQVQSALYNGYEMIKNNHVPALVHNTDDTLEIAKITRRKMNDKMKDFKYSTLNESFGTTHSTARVPDFDSVFVIEKMKASIQGKDNAIKKLRTQITQLKETRSEADRTLDFRTDSTEYYERVGIFHQKTVLRTPQQKDIVERGNHTLVEVARTMLIFSKALKFL
ncbi:retrovirus-related pol polyprotein from transposon TNT 1-94 [Tanacetum coccineum]